MKYIYSLILSALLLNTLSAQQIDPPEPYGAIPTLQQVSWQKMEYYMFIHFGPNTFTDMEWGHGDEDPEVFNPTQLDARQWARIAKAAGMKAIIITAKHHDGFCLWPSEYSTHTVRESPWKNGQGDVLRELSEACKEYGLKFGVYLSPWDMNHPAYGTPEYNQIFANTLDEVLSNYGEVFEQWFDGANGEGPNGKRQEYNWPLFHGVVYKNQPQAIIFSDIGPGCRWVGNEAGIAGETNWSTLNTDGFGPGALAPDRKSLNEGNEGGENWVPAESDVSIRPGWFYSPSTDDKVKTLNHLLKIYHASVGRNSNLLLNVPVDRRGLIHANDSARLMELREVLDKSFESNIALSKKVGASNVRGNEGKFGGKNLSDENYDTYWATDDNVQQASFTMDLGKPVEINRVVLQEYIPLGQRVKSFNVEFWDGTQFVKIDEQTTIGYKRILVFPTLKTSKVRVNILEAKASPALSEFQLYKAPEMMGIPEIKRDKNGVVEITSESLDVIITYTTDGTEPTMKSKPYQQAFGFPGAGIIKAKAFINRGGQSSETVSADFDLAPKNWTVLSANNESKGFEAWRAIDANPRTYWHTSTTEGGVAFPHELAIDLGEAVAVQGFSYTPHQSPNSRRHGHNSGIIYQYSFYISENGQDWEEVIHNGSFANIKNNPVKQEVKFDETYKARYVKLVSLSSVNGEENWSSAGEIGVITK
ncbi:MAG: alpha-L-fucosidase [Anditalea sp.]